MEVGIQAKIYIPWSH